MSRAAATKRYAELKEILYQPYGMERLMEMWRTLYGLPGDQIMPKGVDPISEILKKEFQHLTPVDKATTAKLLGLQGWRIGVHRLPGVAELWVNRLWWVEVKPSFDATWVIAGMTGHAPQEPQTPWRKAILVDGSESGVMTLQDATIEDKINAVPCLANNCQISRDGIGYGVHAMSTAVKGEFTFENPSLKELMELEHALRGLGDEIAESTQNAHLKEVMAIWWRYTGNR